MLGGTDMPGPARTLSFPRPYVISWNLTYRCNLACEHCYLDAGGAPLVDTENFADRSELGTEECFRVIDEIAAFAPECLTILTGGEPLLRRDILEIVRRASERVEHLDTRDIEVRVCRVPCTVRPIERDRTFRGSQRFQ